MQISEYPEKHLSYCTNIHPGENWNDVFEQLKAHLPDLKQRLSPKKPFGIGLRLSAMAASELLQNNHLKQFKEWLQVKGLYVFTINGFPYGSFHGEKVKDDVYKPDWSTKQRLEYSSNLVDILAELIPNRAEGSISTSPVSYKYWEYISEEKNKIKRLSSIHLAQLAWQMAGILRDQKKDIHLDIEPEPDCLLENSTETIDFFENYLLPAGSEFMVNTYRISAEEAQKMLLTHIGVCYDTCHFALEYEDPSKAIQSFVGEGIRIGKIQISSALKVQLDDNNENRSHTVDRLSQFDEPTYLHQVIERDGNGNLTQYRDLPDALPSIQKKEAKEWRIHFHVPIFVKEFEGLSSTQDEMAESLKIILDGDHCRHFEIETYTWDVLPEELKTPIYDSIEREFRWVLDSIK